MPRRPGAPLAWRPTTGNPLLGVALGLARAGDRRHPGLPPDDPPFPLRYQADGRVVQGPQKDLGAATARIVGGITAYSPDDSWDPTSD